MLRLHASNSNPDVYDIEVNDQTTGAFGTMPQEPQNPGKCVKPDHAIQLNCGEMCTRASYKTTRTRENFNNQGIKMILLSGEV